MSDAVLTVEEAAKLLRISRGAAYEAARTGELPTVKVGRTLRVPRQRLVEMIGDLEPAPARLALTVDEAAASLGISRELFDEHVKPAIRSVQMGRRIVVPVKELERYLERHAARALPHPAETFSGPRRSGPARRGLARHGRAWQGDQPKETTCRC